MTKWTLVLLATTALAGCSQQGEGDEATPTQDAAAAAPADPGDGAPQALVLTANGYGPLRIGMRLDEVNAAMGPDDNPDDFGGPEPESCDMFHPENAPAGMFVMIENGALTRISLGEGSPTATAEGLSVGDPAADVRAAYADRLRAEPHNYVDPPGEYLTAWTSGASAAPYTQDPAARGIRYEIGMDGNVEVIHAGGPSIQYVEGCL